MDVGGSNPSRGSNQGFIKIGDKMGKHHDKIKEMLEIRIRHTPNNNGFNKPGSMNKKKTGYIKRGKGR